MILGKQDLKFWKEKSSENFVVIFPKTSFFGLITIPTTEDQLDLLEKAKLKGFKLIDNSPFVSGYILFERVGK